MSNTKISNSSDNRWGTSILRSTLNNSTINSLENKEYIKQVNKEYIQVYNNPNSVAISNDKLWLLSVAEIWGSTTVGGYQKTITTEGKRYKFYSVGGSVRKGLNWWTSSPSEGIYSHYTCFVYGTGECRQTQSTNTICSVSLGFCI